MKLLKLKCYHCRYVQGENTLCIHHSDLLNTIVQNHATQPELFRLVKLIGKRKGLPICIEDMILSYLFEDDGGFLKVNFVYGGLRYLIPSDRKWQQWVNFGNWFREVFKTEQEEIKELAANIWWLQREHTRRQRRIYREALRAMSRLWVSQNPVVLDTPIP